MMLADWRAMTDWQIADIREELGISPVPSEGLWADTNRLVEDPPYANDDVPDAVAAE
jgi:ubiquinone biosynthesis protein COQ4